MRYDPGDDIEGDMEVMRYIIYILAIFVFFYCLIRYL